MFDLIRNFPIINTDLQNCCNRTQNPLLHIHYKVCYSERASDKVEGVCTLDKNYIWNIESISFYKLVHNSNGLSIRIQLLEL